MTGEEKFDQWAEQYDSWFQTPRGSMVYALEEDLIMTLAAPMAGEGALDVGCGTGNFLLSLLERDLEVTGIDPSPKMLAVARKKVEGKGKEASFHQAHMEAIPLPGNTFDLVLSVSALESSSEPELGVAEMWRVTRPGGRLVIGVLNGFSPWAQERKGRQEGSIWEGQHFYTPEELLTLLTKVTGVPRGEIAWNSAVFFSPHPSREELARAWNLEQEGRLKNPQGGALLVARVDKKV